jgi:hypothetical protein
MAKGKNSEAHRYSETHPTPARNQCVMNTLVDPQELARRFNGDEAAWRALERKRELRQLVVLSSLLPTDIVDYIEWLDVERDCHETVCFGRTIP